MQQLLLFILVVLGSIDDLFLFHQLILLVFVHLFGVNSFPCHLITVGLLINVLNAGLVRVDSKVVQVLVKANLFTVLIGQGVIFTGQSQVKANRTVLQFD